MLELLAAAGAGGRSGAEWQRALVGERGAPLPGRPQAPHVTRDACQPSPGRLHAHKLDHHLPRCTGPPPSPSPAADGTPRAPPPAGDATDALPARTPAVVAAAAAAAAAGGGSPGARLPPAMDFEAVCAQLAGDELGAVAQGAGIVWGQVKGYPFWPVSVRGEGPCKGYPPPPTQVADRECAARCAARVSTLPQRSAPAPTRPRAALTRTTPTCCRARRPK